MPARLTAANLEYFEDDASPITSNTWTGVAWAFFVSDPASNDFCIIQIGDKDSTNKYARMGSDGVDGALQFQAKTGGTAANALTTTNLSQNTWHHCAIVSVAIDDRRVLLDGGSVGTNGAARDVAVDADRVSVGVEGDSSRIDYFDGILADVCIWNVALTDAEIALLALGVDPRYIRPGNLIRYWDFIDGTSGRDLMGNQNLTAFNTPTQGAHGPPRTLYTPKWAASVPLIETAGGAQTITPSVVTASMDVVAPTVSGSGSATLTPGVISTSMAVIAPTITQNLTITPSVVTASMDVVAPTVSGSGSATLTPGVISTSMAVIAPTIQQTSVITPGVISTSMAVIAPTIQQTFFITPAVISTTMAVISPTVAGSGSATLTPAVSSITMAVIAPTVSLAALIVTATAISLTMAVIAATVRQVYASAAELDAAERRLTALEGETHFEL